MLRSTLILLLSWFSMGIVLAQQNDWQYYFELLVDELQDEEESEEESELSQTLSAIAASPLNINALTREDLEELQFLTNNQIEAVLEYVARYGPLLSKAEMMMIPFLDSTRRNLLACLTYIGSMPPREYTFLDSLQFEKYRVEEKAYTAKENKGEVVGYIKLPFYSRRGDEGVYAGSKYKHWLRASYQFDHVKIGLTASQDAGEAFRFDRKQWGYDYYSLYIQLQKIGIIKNLVLGQYRVKAGLGLIVNNNLYFGKTFGLSSAQLSSTVVRPHSSRSEGNFLQGAAATLSLWRNADLTAFASYRQIDATLVDSTYIRTVVTSGYHRTESEINRRHNAAQATAGLNLRYSFHSFSLGLTGVYNHYSMPLKPYTEGASSAQLYRLFYPAGQNFWNISLSYGWKYGNRFRIEGETATGDCGRVATVNSLSFRVSRTLTLSAIYRYYPVKFTAVMGQSFSEGGRNQNENGIYLGATWALSERFTLNGYFDYAYFEWSKYLALGSSNSFDNFIQATYKLTPHSSLTARYRLKMRQRNSDVEGELIYRNEHRLRLAYSADISNLTLRLQADASYCSYRENSAGLMLFPSAKYSWKWGSATLGVGYFKTKDYYSRIYIYEQALPYTFSSTAFFGHGIRVPATIDCRMLKDVSLMAKFGYTHYFDRSTIGSSYQMIASSSQTDLELMLRWRV